MSQKSLPPLEVGQAYIATDFQSFEYSHRFLNGQTTILRLHLKNQTTLDLPASDEALTFLLNMLIEAYPTQALAFLKTRPWCPEGLREK